MIYICSHKPDKIPYKLDCTYKIVDNNNSDLPENYRHLRGMKQIWEMKNLPEEIGIFQHRRYLECNSIPESYDIVVPNNFCICQMRSQYGSCHKLEDLDLVEKIIDEPKFSEYIRISNNHQCYWHNIFICRKDFFIKYCDFLFTVLNAYYEINGDRDVCFLAERIGSYFIWKNIPKENIYISKTIILSK